MEAPARRTWPYGLFRSVSSITFFRVHKACGRTRASYRTSRTSSNRSGGFLPAWPLPPVAPCSLPDCPQTDAIALVDLDGDGLLDLVEANYGDPSIWRRNRGHARGFERPTSLPGSASTYTQALAFGSFPERTEE